MSLSLAKKGFLLKKKSKEGGLSGESGGAEGLGVSTGKGGGEGAREGPLYRENKAPFDENALKERKRAQLLKSAKERFCVKIANNQVCRDDGNSALVIGF